MMVYHEFRYFDSQLAAEFSVSHRHSPSSPYRNIGIATFAATARLRRAPPILGFI